MSNKILILGGTGRIGSSVAADLVAHTKAQITITGRNTTAGNAVAAALGEQVKFEVLDLEDQKILQKAIANSNIVIHCAGPFHYRDARVLKICIEAGVNYLDVSDHRSFTIKALDYKSEAEKAGVTAIVNTGIFPGISNSMVLQDVEEFDHAEKIHLSYVVSGSGGAGVTVMRTTFLGLQRPFEAWIDGKWQTVKPYSDREIIEFPKPYDRTGVYWYDMPETFTLPATFPVKTVITKFGSVPDFYNYLTWIIAHKWPTNWLQSKGGIEFLARVSHRMTNFSDLFTGIGVAIRSEVTGIKDGKSATFCSNLVHENTAVAAAYGTGSIAELILDGKFKKPGVWAVEQALLTALFRQTMESRGVIIQRGWVS